MTGTRDVVTPYAASVNPPRRAKRARTGSLSATDRAAVMNSAKPAQRHDPDTDSGEEDEYDPSTAVPPPKRRGRKPGTMSRSARESLRKLNHSRIEKARRTKINETLATLSTLVNEADRAKATARGDVIVEPQQEAKGKPEEKEFKLDVLVKAVIYMQELIEQVKALEGAKCTKCDESVVPPSPSREGGFKRKRSETDLDADTPAKLPPSRPPPRSTSESETPRTEKDERPCRPSMSPLPVDISPRLPPIASWLPHPYIDPSCFTMLPEGALPSSAVAATGSHLPSPPSSGRFRPVVPTAAVPSLSLPGPVSPRMTRMSLTTLSGATGAQRGQSMQKVTGSPTISPTWTPEDESAASLLLQMSSSPGSASAKSSPSSSATVLKPSLSSAGDAGCVATAMVDVAQGIQVETPGSLLGLRGRQ
ncbi:hypothetical protein OBBRIDRAFT_67888 [Obba rivulosa]|uniref:BHLH domain-containing protein n=1 Tax=Obba rivulosa TaxID=1052685 RepID=A0A8E2DKC5_9APHY|nr:hypothetical protein OBBRIDRAFT_67888 [Obba rivulosa]